MIEADDTKFNAGETASRASRGDSRGDDAQVAAPSIAPLVLQSDLLPGDRAQYHVAELLGYHDRHFIESVYRAILRRAPSQVERARELEELRGGRSSKVEIIERVLSSPEARASGRAVRIEGLPSPLMRRLTRLPVIGYAVRLLSVLLRLPVLMQHQQQFEIYALAQQQLIADHINRRLAHRSVDAVAGDSSMAFITPLQSGEIDETIAMFSDALLELTNNHAELQARTQTQIEQAQAALAELTEAITVQQQLAEALRREQQLAVDAQQEFLIQEQRVIVETQKVVLEELRAELHALSERQLRAREEFDAELRRLRAPQAEAAAAQENLSGQT